MEIIIAECKKIYLLIIVSVIISNLIENLFLYRFLIKLVAIDYLHYSYYFLLYYANLMK